MKIVLTFQSLTKPTHTRTIEIDETDFMTTLYLKMCVTRIDDMVGAKLVSVELVN